MTSKGPELTTGRLTLRRWRSDDLEPFATMNADRVVMEFFPSTLTRQQSDDLAARADAKFDAHGVGLWAVELLDTSTFIGFVGLSPYFADDPQPFSFAPGVEIGWRLARDAWGKGLATEAALECLRFGFSTAGLEEITSFTSELNERSQAVMRKIGMRRNPDDDFDHPRLPPGHPLTPHVLYRITRGQFALMTQLRGKSSDVS